MSGYVRLPGPEEEEDAPAPAPAPAPEQKPQPPQLQQQTVQQHAGSSQHVYGQPAANPAFTQQAPIQQQPAQWQPAVFPTNGVMASEVSGFSFPVAPQQQQYAYPAGIASWAMPTELGGRFREWRGGLLNFAGDHSSRDVSICCIGAWRAAQFVCPVYIRFPYVLFGQNMNRALLLKYGSQSMLYFLCVYFFRWIINFLGHNKCGYEPRFIMQSPHHSLLITGRKMLQQTYYTNEMSTEVVTSEEAEYDIERWAVCMYPYTVSLSFAWVIMIVFFMYGGYRRTQIRRKFAIRGDDTLDYVAWLFCAPCAVCQETRTLAYNNVEGGEWIGPSQEAFGTPGYPQGVYPMQMSPYGLQLHPLNDSGITPSTAEGPVAIGSPMQQHPQQHPQQHLQQHPQHPQQQQAAPVMGYAAPSLV